MATFQKPSLKDTIHRMIDKGSESIARSQSLNEGLQREGTYVLAPFIYERTDEPAVVSMSGDGDPNANFATIALVSIGSSEMKGDELQIALHNEVYIVPAVPNGSMQLATSVFTTSLPLHVDKISLAVDENIVLLSVSILPVPEILLLSAMDRSGMLRVADNAMEESARMIYSLQKQSGGAGEIMSKIANFPAMYDLAVMMSREA